MGRDATSVQRSCRFHPSTRVGADTMSVTVHDGNQCDEKQRDVYKRQENVLPRGSGMGGNHAKVDVTILCIPDKS